MSEGTMQRPAQRVRREKRDDQRAKRLHRVLVCAAAVPVTLIAAGCSSDSGSGSGSDAAAADKGPGAVVSASPSASPTVQAAAYKSLPKSCAVVTKKTLGELVPKAKSGKEGTSSDTATRANCSWTSLDNNGVEGSQFRWLNVSLLRFESDTSRGTGNKQAQAYYETQIQDAQAVDGAKNVKSEPVAKTGDEATAVRYDLKKKEGSFKEQTVVARVENVVVTLDYNGAGLAGEKTPSAASLTKLAEKAAKEAVAAVSAANSAGGSGTKSPSASASKDKDKDKGTSKSSSSPSADESSKESPSASPSQSAAKKS
ncbi:DUF3558 domain-containing protein [Streptomyces sp. NPDC050619]|uniref:DUF3558 domain-containing protein n=1 Tax=Streptomyces sp. NPDC050619 TaxID=3157214 RepID=UPI0034493A4D